jgi:hypothetical protein
MRSGSSAPVMISASSASVFGVMLFLLGENTLGVRG